MEQIHPLIEIEQQSLGEQMASVWLSKGHIFLVLFHNRDSVVTKKEKPAPPGLRRATEECLLSPCED